MKQTCSSADAIIVDEGAGDESVSRIVRLFVLLLVNIRLFIV
jgi:hypothetical protein